MALVTVENGLMTFLLNWATKANAEQYRIGLFQSNTTLTVNTVATDLTPASFGGYTGVKILTSWTTGGIVFNTPRAVVKHPAQIWTASGASQNTVYGYYVVTEGGLLLWAERRAAGGIVVGTVEGQSYTVIPRYTFRPEP